MKNFRVEHADDGVAVLIWDMPGKSMNVIDQSVMDELDAFIDWAQAEASLKGVVITSGKTSFSGGADLGMLAGYANLSDVSSTAEKVAARDAVARLGTMYRKLETGGKPFVAAINGTCMGGALELALACHYRIATDDPRAKLGLPEARVGLLPGAGGTQRLPRMIGAQPALRLMMRGEHIDPQEALRLKLIDEVQPAAAILAAAKRWIADKGTAIQPWDRKDGSYVDNPYSPKGMATWSSANALYRKESFDNYHAQQAILACVYEGLLVKTIDAGLLIERDYFAKLLLGSQSKTMIRSMFHSMQDLNKGARRPKGEKDSKINRLGVVGSGFMGSGIALASARSGIEVVLIDVDLGSAEKAIGQTRVFFDKEMAKGRATAQEKSDVLGRMKATTDFAALADCDLVIEAVFENRAVKAETWAKIDKAMNNNGLRASNTSTLPITSLAAQVRDAGNFIGTHFFSPVDKMQLVEIIMGEKTSPAALAKAMDYVKQIRKTPIIVNDSRGFFTSRVVTAHIAEAHFMLEEGVPAVLIEHAGRMAGMPVGPLALADEIALDLQWKIMTATKADLGSAYVDGPIDRILQAMVVERQRLGRKNRKGYYDYPEDGKKRLWPGLTEIVAAKAAENFDIEVLKERILLIQALETARCFSEKVLTDVREADVGAILGFGFAPFTGGPLSYIDTMGTRRFVDKCNAHAAAYGPRYLPPNLLIEMAKNNELFYERFAP